MSGTGGGFGLGGAAAYGAGAIGSMFGGAAATGQPSMISYVRHISYLVIFH